MSTSLKLEHGTLTTLVASGAAVSNNARSVLSSAYDNSVTDSYPYADMELQVTYASVPIADSLISVYIIPAIDGTNYADGSDSVIPSTQLLAGFFSVKASTSAQRLVSRGMNRAGFDLPNTLFKVTLLNGTNQTMSAAWVLKLSPFRIVGI